MTPDEVRLEDAWLLVKRLDDIYVGLLSAEELTAFDACCQHGWARRVYTGIGGQLGLAKVQLLKRPR